MRIVILCAILFAGCREQSLADKPVSALPVIDTVYVHDTVHITAPDSLLKAKSDSIRLLKDTINARTVRLNLTTYKMYKLDYYIQIVTNNSSQLVFLKGWRNRTMGQK